MADEKIDRALRAARKQGGLLDDNPNWREQIANALMQPSTGDVRNALTNTVVERGSILPLATYADGTTRMAMPEWANSLWEIASLQRRPDPTQGDALLLGGAPALGAAPFAPRGAVGSAGGRLGALPMDEASRMARARELGYDTDRLLYHGTFSNFDEFNANLVKSRHRGDNESVPQVHTTTVSSEAETYGPNVMELYARGNFKDIDNPMSMQDALAKRMRNFAQDRKRAISEDEWRGVESPLKYETAEAAERLADLVDLSRTDGVYAHALMQSNLAKAKRSGYDGVRIRGGWGDEYAGDHYVIFDPKNIRSTQAAFDPAKSNSANLLASNPPTAAINALIAAALQGYPEE